MSQSYSQDSAHTVEVLMQHAIAYGASDIHLESRDDVVRVRFRIDGVLHDQQPIETVKAAQIIARIKVLADIDVAQTRIAQDGTFSVTHGDRVIDVRVATFPAVGGEKVVMRILYRNDALVALEHLGMNTAMLEQCKEVFARSSGFVLVSGPTGAGKTTTLYAALSALNQPEKHIVTLEDPVEYVLPGVTQGQVHTAIGFGFADGLRALLRQDPDIVLIGEMRDQATAQIALQAALTGHLVLSTVHTTDAPSVIIRLMDMGIEPFLINAALSCVIAQRLVRKLCTACKQQRAPSDQERALLQRFSVSIEAVYDAHGCNDCFGFGYKGRIGVFELLMMHESLQQFIIQRPSIVQVRTQAMSNGFVPMIHDALAKVRDGLITMHELLHVL